jgi:hypothetical protein
MEPGFARRAWWGSIGARAALAIAAVGFFTANPRVGSAEGLDDVESKSELAPGLWVERVLAPPAWGVHRQPLVTLVRVDPRRYDLVLLTAQAHDHPRTLPQWQAEFGLTGVINASMYMPNLRSTGLMIDGDRVNNGYDNPRFGGYLGFGPREEGLAPVVLEGRTCEGFDIDRLRDQYRFIVQSYRLLDCGGVSMAWRDSKLYSSAAIALDDDGWVVFLHTGTPYRMQELSEWLAGDELGLVAAIFVEGGPQAALLVEVGDVQVQAVGSYESSLSRGEFRPVPNVIGFRPRSAGR